MTILTSADRAEIHRALRFRISAFETKRSLSEAGKQAVAQTHATLAAVEAGAAFDVTARAAQHVTQERLAHSLAQGRIKDSQLRKARERIAEMEAEIAALRGMGRAPALRLVA